MTSLPLHLVATGLGTDPLNRIFQKESLTKYSQQNRNPKEWNLSERIFQKGIFQKEYFRRNFADTTF
jgi:hypothetical protein